MFLQNIGAQSYHLPVGHDAYHIYDRLEIMNGGGKLHTGLKFYSRKDMVKSLSLMDLSGLGSRDQADLDYLQEDNGDIWKNYFTDKVAQTNYQKEFVDSSNVFYTIKDEKIEESDLKLISPPKPFLKYFYKSRANFFEVHEDGLNLVVNPILNLNFGSASNNEDIIFQNTRGIELRGDIDDKLYFYSALYENQANFNDYHVWRINKFQAVPGQGLYKDFQSSVSENFKGYDYANATAYLGYNLSKSVGIELGHGKHFIGNGYQSLLLSDYSHNYFYFKFMVNIWKIKYQSVIAELASVSGRVNPGDNLLPKKYMATHFLSFKPHKRFEIGLFESVVFAREDQFELQYLNPVILYRSVEHFIDSPDNLLVGLDLKWNFINNFSFYSQLILDEFKIDELTAGTGWWANKYGIQAGLKYINVAGIDHLDAQVEYNIVRPYTYSHRDTLAVDENFSVANYSHYFQPLAHPIGANFKELIVLLRYQPIPKLGIKAKAIMTKYGEDSNGSNWGTNVLLPNQTREMNFGNEIGQGENVDVMLLGLDISYMFYHNFNVDFTYLNRTQTSSFDELNFDTNYYSVGIRVNTAQLRIDY